MTADLHRSASAAAAFTIAMAIVASLATPARAASTVQAAAGAPLMTVVGKRSPHDVPQLRVGYGDLNLASRAGQRILNRRVDRAVESVCQSHLGGQGSMAFDHYRCLKAAADGAKPQVAVAIQRATEIAATGSSSIPPVAIAIGTAFVR